MDIIYSFFIGVAIAIIIGIIKAIKYWREHYSNTQSTTNHQYSNINAYNNYEQGKSLTEIPNTYVIVDIETSGLSPVDNEIIEIGALRVSDGVIIGSFQSLTKPLTPINNKIINLTGITNEMLQDAPPLKDVLIAFSEFLGDDVIVGHNVIFDMKFLLINFIAILKKSLNNNFIDFLHISRKTYPHLQNHKLVTVAKHLNIDTTVTHRAMDDCYIVFQCLNSFKQPFSNASDNQLTKFINQKNSDCCYFNMCLDSIKNAKKVEQIFYRLDRGLKEVESYTMHSMSPKCACTYSAEELITSSINRLEELKIQVLAMKTPKGRSNNIIKMENELKRIISLWQEGLNPYSVNLLSSENYKQKILSETQVKLNEIEEIKREMEANT